MGPHPVIATIAWTTAPVLVALTACDRASERNRYAQDVAPYPLVYEDALPPIEEPAPPFPKIRQFGVTMVVEVVEVALDRPQVLWRQPDGRLIAEPPSVVRRTEAPLLGTAIILSGEDGAGIRLVDSAAQRPGLEDGPASGRYKLILTYEPENPNDIIGREVTAADRFTRLVANYAGALRAHGLRPTRVIRVTFMANDVEVASVLDPASEPTGAMVLPEPFQQASSVLMTSGLGSMRPEEDFSPWQRNRELARDCATDGAKAVTIDCLEYRTNLSTWTRQSQ